MAEEARRQHTWVTLAELLAYDYDQVLTHYRAGQPELVRTVLDDWYFDRLELPIYGERAAVFRRQVNRCPCSDY